MEEFRIIAKELVELFTTASLQGIFPSEIKTKTFLNEFSRFKNDKMEHFTVARQKYRLQAEQFVFRAI